VVATGLGRPVARAQTPAQTTHQTSAVARPSVVRRNNDARPAPRGVDYEQVSNQPAFMRKRAVGDDIVAPVEMDAGGLLDIPAFLRRQAD